MPFFSCVRRPGRVLGPLIPVLVSLAAGGCGTQYVEFRPVGVQGPRYPGFVSDGQYRLPPGTNDVDVSVQAYGTIQETKRGLAYEQVEVSFEVRNRGKDVWALDPAKAKFLSDSGQQITGAQAVADKTPLESVVVPPSGKETFRLLFDLPPEIAFRRMGSFRVQWLYSYGDQQLATVTKFLKVVPERYAYYPGYYYPSPGPYGPGGWYTGPLDSPGYYGGFDDFGEEEFENEHGRDRDRD